MKAPFSLLILATPARASISLFPGTTVASALVGGETSGLPFTQVPKGSNRRIQTRLTSALSLYNFLN
jgi:hypothetical protein